MTQAHDHVGPGCDCIAFRLINYAERVLVDHEAHRPVAMALGLMQGARAAMLHPEWAQALVREDDERLGPEEAAQYRDRAERMVEAIPLTATESPP